MKYLFQDAFGCSHSNLSRVFTIERRTYRVCFDCAQELDYSWGHMRRLRGRSVTQPTMLPPLIVIAPKGIPSVAVAAA